MKVRIVSMYLSKILGFICMGTYIVKGFLGGNADHSLLAAGLAALAYGEIESHRINDFEAWDDPEVNDELVK